MKKIISAVGLFACMTAFATPTISNVKATPISPLGLAIDYNVSGATDADSQRELEVSLKVNGTTYQAESLGGTCQGDEFQVTTDCVNGEHRVYWHMGMDFLTLNADNAVLTVRYKGYTSETMTTHDSLYCVVDLSTGAVEYRDDMSPSDLNIDEYKKTKVVLRRIDSGSFIMGEDQTDTSHRVTISEPFYMGMFEVTQAQWTNVYGANPSNFSGDTRPVECVSYNMIRGSGQGAKWPEANSVDATSFLGKLRAMTKIDFDLPTEAQWEYACRAGTQTAYNLGNSESDLAKAGWYDANSSGTTHSVGSKTPNDWGLYDMHGNVWEWTLDWSGELSYGVDPVGASSAKFRMLRGGGFGTDVPSEASVWSRENDDYPSCSDAEDYGFRLVMPMQTETTKTTVEAVSATIAGVKVSSISNQDAIEGSVVVSTAPTTAKKATFKVDDDESVLISSTAETYTWKPTTLGEHKLAHECNGYSISSTYNFVKTPEIYFSIAYTNLKGASNTNPTTYLEGMAVSFVNPGEVTGYTFAGWTPSAITADMTGDQTVTANWTANSYTIKYDANGGEGTTEATACAYDADGVVSANGFTRTGYAFLGWATEKDGEVVYKSGAKVKNLVSAQGGCVTLYAVWSKIEKSEVVISELKVTPIPPLGLAIDYTMSGVPTMESADESTVVVTAVANGTNYVAKSLSGATNCVNGAHRVYWNMAADGIALDASDLSVRVAYVPLYCVVDLSEGSGDDAEYSVAYWFGTPKGGFNTDEYKTNELVLRRCPAGADPLGRYTLTKDFYAGVFEVTQKQWNQVMGSSKTSDCGSGDTYPVYYISYDDVRGSSADWPSSSDVEATAFFGKLRAKTGDAGFDLPTEAQWEYACRAGTTTTYNTGDTEEDLANAGWYLSNSSGTAHPVGKKTPNAWGIYDMHGNMKEWCLDVWHGTLSGEDPVGPTSSYARRCMKGGSWSLNLSFMPSSYQDEHHRTSRYSDFGFRVFLSSATCHDVAATVTGVECHVIADKSEVVDDVLTLGAAPTENANAVVTVDGEVVINAAQAKTVEWKASVHGDHTVAHAVDGVSISATYDVVKYSRITYASLKGATNTNLETYREGVAVSLADPGEVVGYTFMGWTPSAITADMTGDQTVTANWTANSYTIKYDANGGLGRMTATSATYDSDVIVSTNEFTRAGYKFLGWAMKKDGEVVYGPDVRVKNLVSDPDGSITLYAVWRDTAEISDVKVVSIPPWGLAIDYTVSGVEVQTSTRRLEVSMSVKGTNYLAGALHGDISYVNGAHRVYWNMAEEGIMLDTTDADVSLRYVDMTYCIIDLSGGSAADSYVVTYTNAPSSEVFDAPEYKTTKLVLKRVDAGSFIMGEDQTNEAHRVTLTKPFCMGLFEVTQKQWELVMGSNPSCFTTDGAMKPVEQVSYKMIRGSAKGAKWPASNEVDGEADGDTNDSFLGRLRKRTGIKFDLPTEAQWEYTCRAGTTTTYSYGDNANGDYMWYVSNSSYDTHEVGTRLSNDWGFYDMHGNVFEWCLDWYGTLAYGTDPLGSSSGSNRVRRGGSWYDYASYCTSSYRGYSAPSYGNYYFGFRLSWTLPCQ